MPQPVADAFRSIPMSSTLGESLERAHGFAREQGHRAVTPSTCCWRSQRTRMHQPFSRPAASTSFDLERTFRDTSGGCSRTCAQRMAQSPRPTPNCCVSCTRRCRPPSSRAAARSTAPSSWQPSWATGKSGSRAPEVARPYIRGSHSRLAEDQCQGECAGTFQTVRDACPYAYAPTNRSPGERQFSL